MQGRGRPHLCIQEGGDLTGTGWRRGLMQAQAPIGRSIDGD